MHHRSIALYVDHLEAATLFDALQAARKTATNSENERYVTTLRNRLASAMGAAVAVAPAVVLPLNSSARFVNGGK
jgi:hypothetical protein